MSLLSSGLRSVADLPRPPATSIPKIAEIQQGFPLDIEKQFGYKPGHWREVNERVTKAWEETEVGGSITVITMMYPLQSTLYNFW